MRPEILAVLIIACAAGISVGFIILRLGEILGEWWSNRQPPDGPEP